jgi:hypothetical protein
MPARALLPTLACIADGPRNTEEKDMQAIIPSATDKRYAKCIEVSKRIRWDIDRDVVRGRGFDLAQKFLPDGLSFAERAPFLDAADRRLLSQVQGRTYASMFGLVERFIGAKMLEITREHALGDQVAMEALVRFTDEELKHQELFRRIEALMAAVMPPGYAFGPQGNDVAQFVLGKSTWAVLALTCHIEIFTQVHYRQSIDPDEALSPLFKDVLFFHWREESQHAILDELEWRREDARITAEARDRAVDDLITLVGGVDGLLQTQASADARYFASACSRPLAAEEKARTESLLLSAYRWQYIVSGAQEPRFADILAELVTPAQMQRVGTALAPLVEATRWPS